MRGRARVRRDEAREPFGVSGERDGGRKGGRENERERKRERE